MFFNKEVCRGRMTNALSPLWRNYTTPNQQYQLLSDLWAIKFAFYGVVNILLVSNHKLKYIGHANIHKRSFPTIVSMSIVVEFKSLRKNTNTYHIAFPILQVAF